MKSFLLCTAFLAVTLSAAAQTSSVTLLTFAGFTFADRFETFYGTGRIEDSFQWGAGLEFGIQPGAAMELIYQRLNADASYNSFFNTRLNGRIGINYILLGATGYAPINDVVSGFGTFNIGSGFTSNIDPSLNINNVAKLAIGGRVGLKVAATDKVSLRIHAQILSPVQWIGGGVFIGTGGSGAAVTTGSTIWQFNLGGSLNYRIK